MPLEKPVPDGHVEVLLFGDDTPINFYFSEIEAWYKPGDFRTTLQFKFSDHTVNFFPQNVKQFTLYGNSKEHQEAVQAWINDQHDLHHPEPMPYWCRGCSQERKGHHN